MDKMRNYLFVASAALAVIATGAQPEARLTLDLEKKGHAVPKTLYGIFFEDINHAADGGLYPELVANRGFDWEAENKFAWYDSGRHGWENDFRGDAQARITIESAKPLHQATPRHVRIEAFGAGQGRGVGLRNRGYHGIFVEKGKKYDLSFYARGLDGYRGGIRVVLENGGRTLSELKVANADMNVGKPCGRSFFPEIPDWRRYAAVFEPTETTMSATLSILLDSPGIVEFEMVSLFPQDTFNGRKNGLRKDLVQRLKDLKPAVMRFPGGCVAEGRDWNNWYDWKLTVGDGSLESRKCIHNTWNYWQTFGLGFYEYFCLCEDIGSEPMPVLNGGITCQCQKPDDLMPMESMPKFAENFLDLIEFANGDATTKWGSLRAKMGHPEPFNMKYLGIGNENWDMGFLERYDALAKIIRKKHPEIQLILSCCPYGGGYYYDMASDRATKDLVDLIDEHLYGSPDLYRGNSMRFDRYPRNPDRPKIYIGEYASLINGGTLYSALCEAAMMTGFERNSDIVVMTSYAPLFAKRHASQWSPDLIWFDNERSVPTVNYYVQQMFSLNLPDRIVPSTETISGPAAVPQTNGEIVLQTFFTAAEFKDVVVKDGSGKVVLSSLPDPAKCRKNDGNWRVEGGVLKQVKADADDARLNLPCGELSDATVTFKARRTGGKNGFSLRFRQHGINLHACFNFGGWGNTRHAIDLAGIPSPTPKCVPGSLENNRWYDVKVCLRGEHVEAWLDGRSVFGNVLIPGAVPDTSFFHTCGYDEKAGEVIVKCVNVAEEPRGLTIDFGKVLKGGKMRIAELSGQRFAKDDFGNPNRCRPVESTLDFAGGREFKTTLKGSSVTIFRVVATP